MKRLINFFVPRETMFFDMLAGQSHNIHESARLFKEFLHRYDSLNKHQRLDYVKRIHEIETKGDHITHSIIKTLNKTFITPLDREDIHQLASSMDDVLDFIDLAAKRIVIYNVECSTKHMHDLADIIVRSTEHMHRCMMKLSKLENIKEHYIAIQELENMADIIHDRALEELFEGKMQNKAKKERKKNRMDENADGCDGTINTIKLKDIYDFLESVTDKCELIAYVLEGIVVKHS